MSFQAEAGLPRGRLEQDEDDAGSDDLMAAPERIGSQPQ